VRLLPVLILVSSLSGPLLAADQKTLVTVTLRGDTLEFDSEAQTVAIHGNATITAETDRPGLPTVAIASGEIEADLAHGQIIAHQEVRLRSQQLSMRGQSVEINYARNEFRLQQGVAGVEAVNPDYPGQPVRGYLLADEIHKEADVIYVVEGRVTTCDRAHPHYSIGVARFTFDTRTSRYTVAKGRISLYGHTLVIPGHYESSGSSKPSAEVFQRMFPGYSSYDGLYMPVSFILPPPGASWNATATVRIGTKLRFPGEVRAVRGDDRETLTVLASRRDEVGWDIDHSSRLDRLPEVSYDRQLLLSAHRDRAAIVHASLGRVREQSAFAPTTEGTVARVAVDYTPLIRARRARQGGWWAVSGQQSFYDDGERLRDLQLELGLGSARRHRTRAATWFVHHEISGSTPYLFDDVYAGNELFGQARVGLGENWAVDGYARMDTATRHLRDFEIGLSKRVHCLTWGARYNGATQRLSLEVNINGLTGDTAPYDAKPVVAPAEVPPLPAGVPGSGTVPGLTLPRAGPVRAGP
jgi:hypothetical protein